MSRKMTSCQKNLTLILLLLLGICYQCVSACDPGQYDNGGTCVSSCPTFRVEPEMECTNDCTFYYPPHYEDPSTPTTPDRLCLACDPTCASCSGPNADDCDTCVGGLYKVADPMFLPGPCVLTCPYGYYGDFVGNCLPCPKSDYNCRTCNSAGWCTSCYDSYLFKEEEDKCVPRMYNCASGTYLHPKTGGECLKECPDGYYGNDPTPGDDATTPTCEPCYSSTSSPFSCKTCSGGKRKDCLTCDSDKYLTADGQCVNSCPKGYFAVNTTMTCDPCPFMATAPSSCVSKFGTRFTNMLGSSTSYSTAFIAVAMGLQGGGPSSGAFYVNLLLCLSGLDTFGNMQFLNVNHSVIASGAYAGLTGSLIPNWIINYNTIEDDIVFRYGIFEEAQISILYFDNFGDTLTTLLFYFTIGMAAFAVSALVKPEKLLHSVLGKICAAAIGLFISNFLGELQTLLIFAWIQIVKVDKFFDAYSRASYAIAIITTVLVFVLQVFSFFKLRTIYKKREEFERMPSQKESDDSKKSPSEEEIKYEWTKKQYEMLYDGFKEDKKHAFFFSCWMSGFNLAVSVIILSLQNAPIAQCALMAILVISFTIFTAIVRPMEDKSASFLFFSTFVLLIVVSIINVVLAISDSNAENLGWAIFYIIMVNTGLTTLLGVGGLAYGTLSFLKKKYKQRRKRNSLKTKKEIKSKNKKNSNKVVPMDGLGPGFDFDSMTPQPFNSDNKSPPQADQDSPARNQARNLRSGEKERASLWTTEGLTPSRSKEVGSSNRRFDTGKDLASSPESKIRLNPTEQDMDARRTKVISIKSYGFD